MYAVQFSETDIVANAFNFFVTGFEAVATTMSFCLYQLALEKQIQNRAREEIIKMKSKHDGKLNNDFLNDLHYLDMVLAGKHNW